MKKALGFAVAGLFAGAATAGSTLYDNPVDTASAAGVDQEFGDFPSFSTYLVDDVSFATAVTINSITAYMTTGNDWSGITGVRVNVFAKTGSLPGAGDDPTAGALAPSFSWSVGAAGELTASGLSIALAPGDYWIGITAVTVFGSHGQNFHFQGTNSNGDIAAYRNPGGGFGLPAGTGWGPIGDFLTLSSGDTAMTIVGVPAPGALALLGIAGLTARRRRRA